MNQAERLHKPPVKRRRPSAFAYASSFVLTVGGSVLSIIGKGIRVAAKQLIKRKPGPRSVQTRVHR